VRTVTPRTRRRPPPAEGLRNLCDKRRTHLRNCWQAIDHCTPVRRTSRSRPSRDARGVDGGRRPAHAWPYSLRDERPPPISAIAATLQGLISGLPGNSGTSRRTEAPLIPRVRASRRRVSSLGYGLAGKEQPLLGRGVVSEFAGDRARARDRRRTCRDIVITLLKRSTVSDKPIGWI
jgi:hypothetical protein